MSYVWEGLTFGTLSVVMKAWKTGNSSDKSCFCFQVVSVEPFRESIYRIHKAANITHNTDKITIVENAVSDVRGEATIKENGDNQGDTRWVKAVAEGSYSILTL